LKESEILLTVVVPICNVERYLRQCLNSLACQSSTEFKVILVDDGSRDLSGEIAKEYTQRCPERFTYIFQENAGLGAARNTGLRHVETRYVEFLDSDDWLLPRTVENVLRVLRHEPGEFDILFMAPVVFDMAANAFAPWPDTELVEDVFKENRITSPQDTPAMYGLEASVNRCALRMAFLKELNFTFPEGVKWEDVFPHFYLFHHARRCTFVRNAGFCYRVNSGSQITALSGAARLDIVPVFASTVSCALENQWEPIEMAYIIQTLLSFVHWSMTVATREVRSQLTVEAHKLCRSLPKTSVKAYFELLRPSMIERAYLTLFRSGLFYGLLKNKRIESAAMRLMRGLKQLFRYGRDKRE